jgi:ABC-type phosphate transport system permease subunit
MPRVDISSAIAIIMFLALFAMAFFWLRRAWRILVNKDYSDVALKGGEAPPNPEKWALVSGLVNLVAGGIALWTIIGVPLWIATGIVIGPFYDQNSWSGLVGSTLWLKICVDFIISRQAHPFGPGKKNKEA